MIGAQTSHRLEAQDDERWFAVYILQLHAFDPGVARIA